MGRSSVEVDYWTCRPHKKRAFHSRADAKKVWRHMRRAYQDKEIKVYECPLTAGAWHLGHPRA